MTAEYDSSGVYNEWVEDELWEEEVESKSWEIEEWACASTTEVKTKSGVWEHPKKNQTWRQLWFLSWLQRQLQVPKSKSIERE